MAISLDALLMQVVVSVILIAPFLWLAGRALVGKDKAKFTDALWIVVLGTVIWFFVPFVFSGIAATLIVFVIWLGLIKHFFDSGWLKAFLIALVTVVILAIVGSVLVAIGYSAFKVFV